jgi:hypothetical protein
MSGKLRQKVAANDAESVTLSLNEKILKKCHTLYTDPEHGNFTDCSTSCAIIATDRGGGR